MKPIYDDDNPKIMHESLDFTSQILKEGLLTQILM